MLLSLSLLIISALSGVALLWIFAKTSRQDAIRTTKKHLQARLLELRLYADDPRVVLRAQAALLRENLRYFGLMLRPALFATVPMILLLIMLDGFYGRRALETGEAAVVTVQLAAGTAESVPVELRAPDGIVVETPAVRAVEERQVSWRIRPEKRASGELRVTVDGEEAGKGISSVPGLHYLAGRRVRSLWEWCVYPGESPLDTNAIEWVAVSYPSAGVSFFGIKTHWLVWFLVFSMLTAFLLKGKFHVTV